MRRTRVQLNTLASMPFQPSLKDNHLQALCVALCDSEGSLTGSEIGRLLAGCGIQDPLPGQTKRWRLHEALGRKQRTDLCANNVLAFVEAALDPALFVANPERHRQLLGETNRALAFAGYHIDDSGHLSTASNARTIPEAERRADDLGNELRRRGVHPEVLSFCRAELLADDYFHVLLEASKSLSDLLRGKVSLNLDGAELVDACFGTRDGKQAPRLAINTLTTSTEWSQHWGLAALLKGTFSFYRNPTAHEPRIKRRVDEGEALDMLTLVSFLYRQLEAAVLVPKA